MEIITYYHLFVQSFREQWQHKWDTIVPIACFVAPIAQCWCTAQTISDIKMNRIIYNKLRTFAPKKKKYKNWSKSFGHLNIKYNHDFSELVNAQRIVLEELRAEEQQNALQTSYLFVKQIIIIVHSFISHSVRLQIHFVAVERQWNIEIVNNFARVHVLWSKSDDSMRK